MVDDKGQGFAQEDSSMQLWGASLSWPRRALSVAMHAVCGRFHLRRTAVIAIFKHGQINQHDQFPA